LKVAVWLAVAQCFVFLSRSTGSPVWNYQAIPGKSGIPRACSIAISLAHPFPSSQDRAFVLLCQGQKKRRQGKRLVLPRKDERVSPSRVSVYVKVGQANYVSQKKMRYLSFLLRRLPLPGVVCSGERLPLTLSNRRASMILNRTPSPCKEVAGAGRYRQQEGS